MTVPVTLGHGRHHLEHAMKYVRRVGYWSLVVVVVLIALWLRVHMRGGLWYLPRE